MLGAWAELSRCLINACCQLPRCHLEIFFLCSHCFHDEDYAQMSLCSWVNVVVGKMTGVNRRAKYVVVSKEKEVPYDYLVLCTGQSYQVSCVQRQPAHHSQVSCRQSQVSCSGQRYQVSCGQRQPAQRSQVSCSQWHS